MKRNSKGFTLIELLIVIAIIGVLAAILIPNLLGARDSTNDLQAQTYMRDAIASQARALGATSRFAPRANLLSTFGLKAVPAGVTFNVIAPATATAASSAGYCMSTQFTNGITYYATVAGGITTTACTTAQ